MTERPTEYQPPEPEDAPPPLFRTWTRLYAAVLIHLAFWIIVFSLFTARFHLPS